MLLGLFGVSLVVLAGLVSESLVMLELPVSSGVAPRKLLVGLFAVTALLHSLPPLTADPNTAGS